jgi:hypothetical protein
MTTCGTVVIDPDVIEFRDHMTIHPWESTLINLNHEPETFLQLVRRLQCHIYSAEKRRTHSRKQHAVRVSW